MSVKPNLLDIFTGLNSFSPMSQLHYTMIEPPVITGDYIDLDLNVRTPGSLGSWDGWLKHRGFESGSGWGTTSTQMQTFAWHQLMGMPKRMPICHRKVMQFPDPRSEAGCLCRGRAGWSWQSLVRPASQHDCLSLLLVLSGCVHAHGEASCFARPPASLLPAADLGIRRLHGRLGNFGAFAEQRAGHGTAVWELQLPRFPADGQCSLEGEWRAACVSSVCAGLALKVLQGIDPPWLRCRFWLSEDSGKPEQLFSRLEGWQGREWLQNTRANASTQGRTEVGS